MSLWPNDKEFTESAACVNAVQKYSPFKLADKNITAFVIADGRTPRTGALLAIESAWKIHSIDPMLKHSGLHPRIERLFMHRKKAENFYCQHNGSIVIVAPHSHANLLQCLKTYKAYDAFIVSLPCCINDNVGVPITTYEDFNCLSPKRRINIYRIMAK